MKLIKSVAIIMGAGVIALVGGFAIGVVTDLVQQARAAKAEHKLRLFVVEPFAKMSILFEECAKGHASIADIETQQDEAFRRVNTLPRGSLQVNLLSELARIRVEIHALKTAAAKAPVAAATNETTQEEPANA